MIFSTPSKQVSLLQIMSSTALGRGVQRRRSGSPTPTPNHRIRVTVRVRPPISEDFELAAAQPPSVRLGDPGECVEEDDSQRTILLRRPYYDTREFNLDNVLGRAATQAQTYEAVARGVVDDVLTGVNGTVLAYGQTGTGKTHTIYGPLRYWRRGTTSSGAKALQPQLELSGIITRAAIQIFAHIDELRAAGDGREFSVRLSSLEIYQENISDLLRPGSGKLAIREDPSAGVYVDGLSEHSVQSPDNVLELVQETATNRATSSTTMNQSSSRSHAILLLRVEHWTPPPDAGENSSDAPQEEKSSVSSQQV